MNQFNLLMARHPGRMAGKKDIETAKARLLDSHKSNQYMFFSIITGNGESLAFLTRIFV